MVLAIFQLFTLGTCRVFKDQVLFGKSLQFQEELTSKTENFSRMLSKCVPNSFATVLNVPITTGFTSVCTFHIFCSSVTSSSLSSLFPSVPSCSLLGCSLPDSVTFLFLTLLDQAFYVLFHGQTEYYSPARSWPHLIYWLAQFLFVPRVFTF